MPERRPKPPTVPPKYSAEQWARLTIRAKETAMRAPPPPESPGEAPADWLAPAEEAALSEEVRRDQEAFDAGRAAAAAAREEAYTTGNAVAFAEGFAQASAVLGEALRPRSREGLPFRRPGR